MSGLSRCMQALTLLSSFIWLPPEQLQNMTGEPGQRGSFVEVEGSKLYYEECGSGRQAVVLVHDGVLHSAAWDDVWPEFCMHFHTIRYDRRGYGQSPAATAGYFAADDLATLLRHLKITRAAIVGSSHGGEISINFTLDHPEIVQQLVLVGAVVGGMPYSKHFFERGEVLGRPLEKGGVQGAIAAVAKGQVSGCTGERCCKEANDRDSLGEPARLDSSGAGASTQTCATETSRDSHSDSSASRGC